MIPLKVFEISSLLMWVFSGLKQPFKLATVAYEMDKVHIYSRLIFTPPKDGGCDLFVSANDVVLGLCPLMIVKSSI